MGTSTPATRAARRGVLAVIVMGLAGCSHALMGYHPYDDPKVMIVPTDAAKAHRLTSRPIAIPLTDGADVVGALIHEVHTDRALAVGEAALHLPMRRNGVTADCVFGLVPEKHFWDFRYV